MADTKLDLLQEMIARNSAAVLSLPSAGLLRHCKTRFLSAETEGFWIESDPAQGPLLDELIAKKTRVGMTFKSGPNRIIFSTMVVRRDPAHRLNRELSVEALLLRFPERMTAVQRRTNYRVTIPSSCEIMTRVWRIPEHWVLRDRPSATLEVAATVRDLSSGGIGLLCPPKDAQPIPMAADCRLRVQIAYGMLEVLVEGRAKHTQITPDNSLRVGVQFKKLEDSLEGRQALTKLTAIVAELQREEVRRVHLGLAG